MAVLIEDTRQQAGKHENKNRWWAAHGIEVVRRKLDFGDYATEGSNIIIDTKRSIAEVTMDVGRDHARFARELNRARESGYRLIILVEVGHPYHDVHDVAQWVSVACRRCEERRMGWCEPRHGMGCKRYKRKPMQGPQVARIMQTMAEEHGCVWEFAHPMHSAKRICELLGLEVREDG